MGDWMPTLLVRYGEIGLKSNRVRKRFEDALVADIRKKHAAAGVQCIIISHRGRIFVDSDDWRRSCEMLSRTFGVVSFSPTTRAEGGMEEIEKAAVAFAEPLMSDGAGFAIRARRSGNHPFTSQDVCVRVGAAVLSAYAHLGVKVRLDDPDVEISVEVRDRTAYLYSTVIPGPGGMPKGTQGRVLSIVSSERGVAASWLLMKRGCTLVAASEDDRLCGTLREWDADLRTIAPSTDPFADAGSERCHAIVMDWGVETFDRLPAPKGPIPVFYPLVGMLDDEAQALARRVSRH
jgi:thiamine biosynthesis protein ThiI